MPQPDCSLSFSWKSANPSARPHAGKDNNSPLATSGVPLGLRPASGPLLPQWDPLGGHIHSHRMVPDIQPYREAGVMLIDCQHVPWERGPGVTPKGTPRGITQGKS